MQQEVGGGIGLQNAISQLIPGAWKQIFLGKPLQCNGKVSHFVYGRGQNTTFQLREQPRGGILTPPSSYVDHNGAAWHHRAVVFVWVSSLWLGKSKLIVL